MPQASLKPCRHPMCSALVAKSGFCVQHEQTRRKTYDQQRDPATRRLYGARWRKARLAYLSQHPLCECPDCQAGKVRVTQAEVVDHIEDHKGDEAKFWNESNWQAMSKQCHDRKTARTVGYGKGK
jgi:5-methylcytosine-specific restriction enzyme A